MAVVAISDFELASVDIWAAFLQAKRFDREIYMKPPEDIQKPGFIWRLKKPLYGLDDASRKFWLKIKEIFLELGLKVIDGNEAFYYMHEEGELKGAVQTHLDIFSLAWTADLLDKIIQGVSWKLTIS